MTLLVVTDLQSLVFFGELTLHFRYNCVLNIGEKNTASDKNKTIFLDLCFHK